jgi:hypothetical protein
MLKHREWFHEDIEKRISDYLFYLFGTYIEKRISDYLLYLFGTGVVIGRQVNYFHAGHDREHFNAL